MSTEDPCSIDTNWCNPPLVEGDDILELNSYILNGYRVVATVVGVDSFTDFARGTECYSMMNDPCSYESDPFELLYVNEKESGTYAYAGGVEVNARP